MKRLRVLATLLMSVGLANTAWALEQVAMTNSEIKVFRNVSGATQVHGTAYILQNASDDANITIGPHKNADSTLGMDVTTTASADQGTFVGCQLDDSVADDGLVRVVTWGPAICRFAGSTDNTNTRLATVGTTTVAGNLGSGTLAGLTMSLRLCDTTAGGEAEECNGAGDNEPRWIWVAPDNN